MTGDELATELAATLRELGEVRAAACTTRAAAWREYAHLAVTERREEVRCATAEMDAEAHKLEADVEALRVELEAERLRELVRAQEMYG